MVRIIPSARQSTSEKAGRNQARATTAIQAGEDEAPRQPFVGFLWADDRRQRVPSHGFSRHIGAGITGPGDQEDEENQQGAVGQSSREHKIAEREADIEHAHDQHHAVRERVAQRLSREQRQAQRNRQGPEQYRTVGDDGRPLRAADQESGRCNP
jgi:hypothetical protein